MKYSLIQEPHYAITRVFDGALPPRIFLLLTLMHWAVQLNDEPRLIAQKVSHKCRPGDGMLAPEFEPAQLPSTQGFPQHILRACLPLTKVARDIHHNLCSHIAVYGINF